MLISVGVTFPWVWIIGAPIFFNMNMMLYPFEATMVHFYIAWSLQF